MPVVCFALNGGFHVKKLLTVGFAFLFAVSLVNCSKKNNGPGVRNTPVQNPNVSPQRQGARGQAVHSKVGDYSRKLYANASITGQLMIKIKSILTSRNGTQASYDALIARNCIQSVGILYDGDSRGEQYALEFQKAACPSDNSLQLDESLIAFETGWDTSANFGGVDPSTWTSFDYSDGTRPVGRYQWSQSAQTIFLTDFCTDGFQGDPGNACKIDLSVDSSTFVYTPAGSN
jgi:hypothetical protein